MFQLQSLQACVVFPFAGSVEFRLESILCQQALFVLLPVWADRWAPALHRWLLHP